MTNRTQAYVFSTDLVTTRLLSTRVVAEGLMLFTDQLKRICAAAILVCLVAQPAINVAQDPIAVYSEYGDDTLKGAKGRPVQSVFRYDKGKLTIDGAWSEHSKRYGWHFSPSPTGQAIYVAAKPTDKAGHLKLEFYAVDALSGPDFKSARPFRTEETKRTEPLAPGAGLSISWSPSGQRFFIRRAFDLTIYENETKLSKLDKVSWSWGSNWAGSESRIDIADHAGAKHWTTSIASSGLKSFDSKAKPYIHFQPRDEKLFDEKVTSECFRVQYSPDGKYIAYVRNPGVRPMVNPDLSIVRDDRYDGPVPGSTSLRIGVKGKSIVATSLKNTATLTDQESSVSGFSGKKLISGSTRKLDWNQISPIGWSPKSDFFYYVISKFEGRSQWSHSNHKVEGTFGKLTINELWRSTPTGQARKVCDLDYMPDRKRYCGNMARRFPDTNESRVSSDGKHLLFWGSGTNFYRKNLAKLEFGDINYFLPARASRYARILVLVDLSTGKQNAIFKCSERAREHSIAAFVGSELKIKDLAALDANPQFIGDGTRLPNDLLPTQLISAAQKRKGTSADGVSQLVIRAEVSAKVPVVFRIEEGQGELAPLQEGKTLTLQGKHYAFALYTPPRAFGGGASKVKPSSLNDRSAKPRKTVADTLEIEDLKIEAIPYIKNPAGKGGRPVLSGKKKIDLMLARPPVVLVHGLGSNPIECWVATKPNGNSMVIALEEMGIVPFCVNYENSNGLHDPDPEDEDEGIFFRKAPTGRNSSYMSNRMVVWDSPDGMPTDAEFHQSYRWLGEEPDPDSWLMGPPPQLPIIPRPRHLRIGGIKQAIEFYREDLDLAATQADLIGHSMGGILSRVYADPNYNQQYRRSENFDQGDIHRLITICTPHHGSELALLHDELFQYLHIDTESFVQWARANVQQKLLQMFLDTDAGAIVDLRFRSRALQRIGRTQIPSFAITTSATNIELGNADTDPTRKYLQLYSGIAMVLFYNRPRLDAWVERRALRWSNASPEYRKNTDRLQAESVDWSDETARDQFKRLLAANIDRNAYHWITRREGSYRSELHQQIIGTIIVPPEYNDNEQGVDLEERGLWAEGKSVFSRFLLGGDVTQMHRLDKEPEVPYEVVGVIRSLIFHNDSLNDGAVRVESQLGGIDASEYFEGVVHSFAPWDDKVQRKVIDLLKWEDGKFFRDTDKADPYTFPPAGQFMNYWLPSTGLSDPYIYGDRAISWSGMVKSHAQQYLWAAENHDVVIVARPVNQDSTRLIELGAATKGMDVKGKSANWGPQKGYIPRKQRFSKLWRVYKSDPDLRQKKIDKFNRQTEDMLANARYPDDGENENFRGKKFAKPRVLEIDLPIKNDDLETREKYTVVFNPDKSIDSENAVFLRDKDGVIHDWRNAIDRQSGDEVRIFHMDYKPIELDQQPSPEAASKLVEMEVLADSLQEKTPIPYLTADYDLLAIGFSNQDFEGPHPVVRKAMASGEKPPELTGYVSPPQWDLIKEVNERIRLFAIPKYESGYLTHHGPETQYPGSEYVDYPLLVFDPGKPKETDDQDATYFVIRQGPPGFRDIHLKAYFWEKKQLGHNIWPNPVSKGWMWEDEKSLRKFTLDRGYDPRDAAGLMKYVDELKERSRLISAIGGGGNDTPSTPPPASEQLEQLRRQAESGNAKSQFALAYALATGKLKDGTEIDKNINRAAYWYERSALNGHRIAQYNLARRYNSGEGIRVDENKAAYWYLKSAEQGYERAYYPTGWRFHFGNGVRRDYHKARHWYEKAVATGSAKAMNNLGILYENGNGVQQDYKKAFDYYKQSSDKNSALGMKNLGDLYYYGRGVEKDYETALTYYETAKILGASTADDAIRRAKEKIGTSKR